MASIGFFLYGDAAAPVAKQEEPRWQAWLAKKFPAPTEAGGVAH
jgi:hypothetical protein